MTTIPRSDCLDCLDPYQQHAQSTEIPTYADPDLMHSQCLSGLACDTYQSQGVSTHFPSMYISKLVYPWALSMYWREVRVAGCDK